MQEMEVRKAEDTLRRQENEARKAERDLTMVHKRQLDKMLQENRRETRKCMRQLRQDLTEVTEQVGVEKQGQADLHRQLLGERKKRNGLTAVVDMWKEKYSELYKIEVDKEYMIQNMNKEMGDKRRAIRTLEKRVESVDVCNFMAVERLENVRNDLENKLQRRNKDVTQLKMQSSAVCCRSPQPYLSI